MDIEILNLFPAMIVVSIERENEFEQERENESSGNARENQTSWREERRQSAVSTRKRNFRSIHVTPGRIVNFIQCLTLLVGPLDSTVKHLNKLTWPRAETKNHFKIDWVVFNANEKYSKQILSKAALIEYFCARKMKVDHLVCNK